MSAAAGTAHGPEKARAAWSRQNQAYLSGELQRLRAILDGAKPEETGGVPKEEVEAMSAPPALTTVVELFGLSGFERDILLFCAGVELDGDFAEFCAGAGGPPTFGRALSALPEPHWSALPPAAPLRYWRLVELGAGNGLTSRALRIDERILHHLVGVSPLDERLGGLLEEVGGPGPVGEGHQRSARRILEAWSAPREGGWPVVELLGPDSGGKTVVAAAACQSLGAPLLRLDAADVPADPALREQLALLWDRESMLTGAVLLMDCEEIEDDQSNRAASLLRRLQAPVLVSAHQPLAARRLKVVRVDVARPAAADARKLWEAELGPIWTSLNGEGDQVVSQFALDLEGIRAASEEVRRQAETGDDADSGDAAPGLVLWRACRHQARPRLDGLAQRVESRASWEDLVLPAPQLDVLRELAVHLRHRDTVYERWGFQRRSARGLGFSALFAGESGTGKTMAAEVLSRELRLDLYRIDLSQVVSKYIGETEKKLSRVFDAAEGGGALLLFDEADALFGKRSEVRDSHDRYANIEVSYLLQRMETYRGLAVLTTNRKEALDPAFLRRLRFVVQFPFPSEPQRQEIWRRVFPSDTPVEEFDFTLLGRPNLTGGNIRNIAMTAAFLAADAGHAVTMDHIHAALRSEYVKLGRPLPEIEYRRQLPGRRGS